MKTEPSAYHGFRFPAEIISHAVWLYHCFSLSLCDVEMILAQRGIVVSLGCCREVQREKESLALPPIRRHGRNSGGRDRACG